MEKNKLLHYSRHGYEGNYEYNSVCGKKIKTHQDNEGSTIHPTEANCKECLLTSEYQTDLFDFNNTNNAIKRRIYIESDILQANEFRRAQRAVFDFVTGSNIKCVERGLSDVLDFAWHDLEKTWAAVKKAEEIWTISSLMPLSGGYTGAPVIFNGMCERAIKEKITGKSVIILNKLEYISWGMIDIDVMKKAFKKNSLFMYNDNYELFKVNVSDIPLP